MRPERQDISKKRKFDNLEGRQFGEITILYPINTPEHVGKTNTNQYYWAKCSCGKEWAIAGRTIRRNTGGRTGARACSECTHKIGGEKRVQHGLSYDRLYRIWVSMKARCNEEKGALSHGIRGISVHRDWYKEGEEGFLSFYNWAMENGYKEELTLDRKDVNGPYSPENCQWVSAQAQNYNKRNSLYIEIDGKKVSLSQYYYSEPNRLVPYSVINNRFRNGWTLEEMFSTPYGHRKDGSPFQPKKESPAEIKPSPAPISKHRKNWTGANLGKLQILYPIAPPSHVKQTNPDQFFWARCSCGKEYAISHHTIMKKVFACKSCTMKEVGKRYQHSNRKVRKRLNKIWLDMNRRCSPAGSRDYYGRGILVCEEWRQSNPRGFEQFYEWAVANYYVHGFTLERIDVNGNYEPVNCTWVPKEDQDLNKRNTIYIEYQGEQVPLVKLHRDLKSTLPYTTIYSRYNQGWSAEKIFSTPYQHKKKGGL